MIELQKKNSVTNKYYITVILFILLITIIFILMPICHAINETSELEYELGNISISAFPRFEENRKSFNYTLHPGDEITDFVIIYNRSEYEKKVITFAADYSLTDEGGAYFKNYYDIQEDVGKWIILEHYKTDLEPYKAKVIKFTIKVPQSVKEKKYIGGILAQDTVGILNGIGLRVAKEINITITDSQEKSDVKKYQEQDWHKLIKKDPLLKNPIFIGVTTIFIFLIFSFLYIHKQKKIQKRKK